MKNLFPTRLRELLRDEKLNQKQFAAAIGVSQSCVSFWLKGERQPTAENLYNIAKLYGVSADFLLGLNEF